MQTKRLLSLSQPELDTGAVFDIPSPPPVAANRFESASSALNQPRLEALDHADVPDVAPIATIPELQICPAASSRESIGPTDPAQVDLDPRGHEGVDLKSAAPAVAPQNDFHQRSAATQTSGDAAVRGETSHDRLETRDTGGGLVGGAQAADVGAASAPGEPLAPEAVPPPAISHRKSPRPVSQDEVYGALYDSLFPQSFTSEVLSSLATPPPRFLTKEQESKAAVRTVDEYRTETSTSSYPGRPRSPASGDRPGCPDPEKSSGSGASSFASSDGAKWSEAARCLPERPLVQEDTPSAVLQNAAPPVSGWGTAPGRELAECVPALARVRHAVRDQGSCRALSASPAPEDKSARDPELKSQTPAPPGDGEGFTSPTYLSVGSDDGSAVDVYYSAEDDNADSGDDEMFTMDEGGAPVDDGVTTVGLHKELVQQGRFLARDGGQCRGTSGGEKEVDGRGKGGEACLQDSQKFPKGRAQVEEEGTEMGEKKLLAKPVLALPDSVPPFAEPRLEETQRIWAKTCEREEPPDGAQRSSGQPLRYPTPKSSACDDARQEVIITTKNATAEKAVWVVSGAEKRSEIGRHTDRPRAESAAADTGSLTLRASAAEHNRLPQSAEWVDTITRSAGGGSSPEPEVQLYLTDAQLAAATPAEPSPG